MKINPQNTIRRVKAYEKDAYTYYPILIVGAGESGIALGCRLKEKLGFDQFRIFERQSGIGGTWWINRYPGVACDVPGVFYSFSFRPNPTWSTFYPSGPEIAKYLYTVCDEYKLVDKIQLNTDVSEMRWLVDEEEWEVTLTYMVAGTGDLSTKDRHKRIAEQGHDSVYLKQEIVRAKIVASAAGGLVEPNSWPKSIPGRDSFQGDVFHSARWNYDVDLNGKDVVVIGTGCSAAQFVPKLTKPPYNANSVTQVMRSPPWVVPRLLPPGGHEKWEKYAPKLFSNVPALARAVRTLLFLYGEIDFHTIFLEKYKEKRKPIEAQLIEHMKKTVPDKYHEILTPDYGVGCKRRIFDATWLPSLNDPKILLTTQPVTSVQPQGVTLGPGRTYPDPKDANSKAPTEEIKLPADTIILANGFELTTWLHPLKIYGKDGRLMQDVWDERGGPQAYLGSAMDGYPNLFIIFGPNTATGHSSVILASENMVEYSLKFIERILNGDVKTVEIKHEAEVSWTKKMQEKLKDTVWMNGGCHSWYKTANGWNATAYPDSQIDFSLRCMFPSWSDWNLEYTRKGLLKKQARNAVKICALVAVIVGAIRLRKDGGSLVNLPGLLRQIVRSSLLTLLDINMAVSNRISQVVNRV